MKIHLYSAGFGIHIAKIETACSKHDNITRTRECKQSTLYYAVDPWWGIHAMFQEDLESGYHTQVPMRDVYIVRVHREPNVGFAHWCEHEHVNVFI
jgi:hypothetical protein